MANYKTGVIVSGNAKGAVSSLKATRSQLDALNKSKKSGSQAAKTYGNSLGQMSGLLKTLVPVVTVAGLSSLVSRTLKSADAIGKMSARIGASTEALSEYRHVAELSGVTFKQLTIGWQRQTRRIAEAAQGTGEARNALKELGLEAVSLNRLKPEDQFEAIARAMEGVDTQADRVRLAMKLWDSEGVALLQTMEGGAISIAQMREEARELGLSLKEDQVAAAEAANDAFTKLGNSAKGLTDQLILKLAPGLTRVINKFTELAKTEGFLSAIAGSVNEAFKTILHGVPKELSASEKAILKFKERIRELQPAIENVTNQLQQLEDDGKKGGAAWDAYSNHLKIIKEEVTAAEKKIAALKTTTEKSTEVTQVNTAATEANKEAKKEQKDTLEELILSIDKEARATHEFMQTMDRLHAEVIAGNLSFERYDELVSMVATGQENAERSTRSLTTATAEASVEVDAFASAWQKAGERIDESFAGFWKAGLDGFENFRESLLDSFKTMLAEMAHQALTRPLLIKMGMVGGGTTASASANTSIAYNSATGQRDVSSMMSTLGAADWFGSTGGAQPNALGLGFMDSVGSGFSWTSNTYGMAGIGAAGAIGGMAGSALWEGEHAGTGAMAGAMAGMAVAGPIGAVVGGLIGGFAGDSFSTGAEATYINDSDGILPVASGSLSQGFEDDVTSKGAFGYLGLTDMGSAGLKAERLQGALDNITAIDDAISDAFGPEATARIRQALDGWTAQDNRADDFTENMLARLRVITDEIDFRFMHIVELGANTFDDLKQRLLTLKEIDDYIQSDLLADQASLLAEAQLTLRDRFHESINATHRLGEAYDGTTEASTRLVAGLRERYTLELQYLNQITAVQQGLTQTIEGSIEAIQLSVMDTGQQYDYFSDKAETLASSLASLSDPAEINRVVQQINTLTNQAYGVLSGEQKSEVAGEFVDFLEGVLDQANTQLDQERSAAVADSEQLRAAMVTAIEAGGERFADVLAEVAETQREAAAEIRAAAEAISRLPILVNYDSLGQPGGPEIGYA
ncbi:MAG: hypothetical protein KZQ95_01750 [Candidatus Thiodiazotropha sp. (ex Epidulcina cf. delphinae)]|nr:hypothetical protein [Candidatus Thiodiazotropha sp. (ex Epidulcina cf. delphinae)]